MFVYYMYVLGFVNNYYRPNICIYVILDVCSPLPLYAYCMFCSVPFDI